MQQKTYKKTIQIAIKKSEIDGKFTYAEVPTTIEEKLRLARSIFEIADNFEDNIEVIFQNDEIVFKWYPPKTDLKAEMLHKNALILARKGNLDEAINKWTQATSINPSDPDYFFNLGVAYFESKKYQESIENLIRVLVICPFYIRAHLILGTAFLKIRKFEFAKKHLIKSIKNDRSNALSFLNLGAVHSILKEYDEGITMFNKAISLSPKEPRAYLGLAKIYSTINNTERANYYFKKVIELDPKGNLANYAKRSIVSESTTIDKISTNAVKGNAEEYYSEGYRYYISGDYTSAAIMYKKYISIKSKDDYVWYALGEAQIRSNKLESALESFKQAILIYPNKGLYYKALLIVFDYLNKSDKVIAAASKAKELDKIDSITYCLWGKALYKLGNFDEAVLMLEHSLRSNRNNFLAKYYLAKTLIKMNATEDALNFLYELKEAKINTPLKQKAFIIFKKLTQE